MYATDGDCTAEASFSVQIIQVPDILVQDVTECGAYALPALQRGNYFTGPGGTGTMLVQGDVITQTTIIYVFAQAGPCSDENSFLVTIGSTEVSLQPLTNCSENGFSEFDLDLITAQIPADQLPGLNLSYYDTLAAANNNVNQISSPYYNLVANSQTIFVRVEHLSTGCLSISPVLLLAQQCYRQYYLRYSSV